MNDINLTNNVTAARLVDVIRSAVNGRGKYGAYVTEMNVTRDNVKDHAVALASLAYPNDKPVQATRVEGKSVRTRFGNAVQAARAGLVAELAKQDPTPAEFVNYLTKDGLAALADMDSDALAVAVAAEVERRAAQS